MVSAPHRGVCAPEATRAPGAVACSGLDNAGKTTIVKRISGEDISTVSPTLGFNIKTLECSGCAAARWGSPRPRHPAAAAACRHKRNASTAVICPFPAFRYQLNIWDVGGQKTLRSYWRNYFEATDGLVWVVDSADVSRLRDCAEVSRAQRPAPDRARAAAAGARAACRR